MSIPTELADGPHGPEPIITVSKKTAGWIAVGVSLLIFSLLTVIWVLRGVYQDARFDLADSRRESQCARELNAKAFVALGEHEEEVGALAEQIGNVFAVLPSSQQDPSAFFAQIQEFPPISAELHRLRQSFDEALSQYSRVNEICTQDTGGSP